MTPMSSIDTFYFLNILTIIYFIPFQVHSHFVKFLRLFTKCYKLQSKLCATTSLMQIINLYMYCNIHKWLSGNSSSTTSSLFGHRCGNKLSETINVLSFILRGIPRLTFRRLAYTYNNDIQTFTHTHKHWCTHIMRQYSNTMVYIEEERTLEEDTRPFTMAYTTDVRILLYL